MISDMSKRLYYSSTHIIFLSLLLTELTNLPTNSFPLTGGDGHEVDFVNIVNHGLSTISILQSPFQKSWLSQMLTAWFVIR
jgi:hypothetical protein